MIFAPAQGRALTLLAERNGETAGGLSRTEAVEPNLRGNVEELFALLMLLVVYGAWGCAGICFTNVWLLKGGFRVIC